MGKRILLPTLRCFVPVGRWLRRYVPVLFCFLVALAASGQSKPNILWLTFEDTSPEFIGCYGNKAAKTPVMDILAAEGTRFTSAYSTGSVCSPSRNALILGCKTYTLGTGNHRSNYPIPDTMTGFPKYLRDAGYYTTNNAKTDYNTSAASRIIQESWDESSGQAGWWKRKDGQPFFAVFNSMSSHQSRTMTEPFAQYKKQIIDQLAESQQTKDADIVMPPFYRDSPAMRRQTARIYNAITKTDTEFGELLARLEKEGLRENTIIFVFADHGEGMPDAKTNGKGLGHRVPFIVWFPEKYKHLSPWKQGPARSGGAVTNEKIDFVDLAPTVLSLAGVEIPSYMQGRSLMGKFGTPERRTAEPPYLFLSSDRSDESYDLTRTVIKGHYAYTRIFMPYIPELRYLQYMDIGEITQHIRSDFKDKKLNNVQQQMVLPRPAELLYDLEKDPWEIDNLAQKKGYEPLLNEFRTQLRSNVLSQRDVLFLPEYEIANLSKTTNAYTFRQQDANYPIRDIYEVASLSGFHDAATLTKQIGSLKSGNSMVRYWALMGLRSQPKPDLMPYQAQLTAALADSYPLNQVIAASILNGNFDDNAAKAVLRKHLDSADDNVANVVMQQLMYQPNASDWVADVEQFYTLKKTLKAKPYHALLSASVFLYAHGGRLLRNETE